MTVTNVRSATQTATWPKVVYVTRKVQADFLAIVDTYRPFTEEYAQDVIRDVRILLDEEVIDSISFVWTLSGANYVLDEFYYEVVSAGIGLADDRSGGVCYSPFLAAADFHVRIRYSRRWIDIDEAGRAEIRQRLALSWGPAGNLDYSGGRWVQDRTYSKDGYGLSRSQFVLR